MSYNISLTNYDIHIGDLSQALTAFLARSKHSSIHLIVDTNTHVLCLPVLLEKVRSLAKAEVILVPEGEPNKNLSTCQLIWNALIEQQADRNALVINLGGGVVGDMGGFAAATYKRGVRFIQIPTTLLSQVDASVGGKLGVDHCGVKNVLGLFQDPQAVFIDTDFLLSLPQRQVTNGFAEVLKHGLIRDKGYWDDLLSFDPMMNGEAKPFEAIIKRSVQIKKQVVEEDFREGGVRKILNFGHTIGHAIESYSLAHDADPLLHGEAIALGMRAELDLSVKRLGCDPQEANVVKQRLAALYPAYALSSDAIGELMRYMRNDKKNAGDEIRFSILNAIGDCAYDIAIGEEEIKAAIAPLITE